MEILCGERNDADISGDLAQLLPGQSARPRCTCLLTPSSLWTVRLYVFEWDAKELPSCSGQSQLFIGNHT